jgi:hypothetical protein
MLSDVQTEVERLHVEEDGVAVYAKLQKICDKERDTQDLRKCNEIKMELCRPMGLAEDFLSVSEKSQIPEATAGQRDVHNPNYKENPGRI